MGLKNFLGRLGRSNEELASADRERLAKEIGCDRINDCRDRQLVTIRGTIDALTQRSHGETPWLEAELSDGTGSVLVVWMGRREIPGIEAGRELVVKGRLSDVDDVRQLFNPRYQLL